MDIDSKQIMRRYEAHMDAWIAGREQFISGAGGRSNV